MCAVKHETAPEPGCRQEWLQVKPRYIPQYTPCSPNATLYHQIHVKLSEGHQQKPNAHDPDAKNAPDHHEPTA